MNFNGGGKKIFTAMFVFFTSERDEFSDIDDAKKNMDHLL